MSNDMTIPPDSFMGRYLAYMQNQETAKAYDWWCALWVVSAACARATYVDRPRAPVYLNMFTILVGESGVTRKTTSVAVASRLARSVIDYYDDVQFLDAKMTPEALDLMLHEKTLEYGNAQLCVATTELAVFMGTERYIAHMPTLLTELYDCPAARDGGGTVERGAVVQRNVWVHFLSASTPVWLLKTVNPNVVEGGFTSRCYFIIANQPKASIPWPIDSDVDLYQDMVDDLRMIAAEARTRKPITLHENALFEFRRWYEGRGRDIDPYKQSFGAREDAHVLRVAALLCINDGSWIVHDLHIRAAIEALTVVKNTGAKVFDAAEVRNKYAATLDVMRMHLISTGMEPIPRGRLYLRVRNRISNVEFMALLDVLTEIGAVQRFEMHTKHSGRPTDLIRGTQKLLDPGLGDKVVERFS